MKVGNTGSSYLIDQVYADNKKKTQVFENKKEEEKKADTFELSDQSKGIKKYVNEMKDTPMNMERVNQIKMEIANGTYKVSAKEIAESMVEKMRGNKGNRV